jgi:hypothetical protein
VLTLEALRSRIRGWFPAEPIKTYTHTVSKPRWKKPQWIALTAVKIAALTFSLFFGLQTFLRWSDPQLDVTANYFEKTVNASSVHVGDCVEVTVRVGWHGRIFPEFPREVKVVDVLPEDAVLVEGSNIVEYRGDGGSDVFTYSIRVDGQTSVFTLPEPKLYLDGTEITLNGTSPKLQFLS